MDMWISEQRSHVVICKRKPSLSPNGKVDEARFGQSASNHLAIFWCKRARFFGFEVESMCNQLFSDFSARARANTWLPR